MRSDQSTDERRSVVPFEPVPTGLARKGELAIVMATYNGAKYLSQQIRSIQDQTIQNWKLLIRDDDSDDETREIAEHEAAADKRICIVSDRRGRLGTVGNFGALAGQALSMGARYVWFCDQDDVWHQGKLERQLAVMHELEDAQGPTAPVAVHSDLAVVDENLAIRAPSFARYQNVRHASGDEFKTLLVQNFVTGCTMLVNRSLAELALPLPHQIVIHDWWMALCAAASGSIGYVDEALTFYRQHKNNQIGARTMTSLLAGPHHLRWRWHTSVSNFQASIEQCRSLKRRSQHWHSVSGESSALVDDYLALFESHVTGLSRTRGVVKLGIWPQRLRRKLLFLCRLFSYAGSRDALADSDDLQTQRAA